jgi:FeS assembly SUF system protein
MKPLPVIQNPGGPQSAPGPADPTGATQSQTTGMANDPARAAALRPQIVSALSTVFDPEIPVNIYELGLIYDIIVDPSSAVGIRMTLTAPACPAAQTLPIDVKNAIARIPDVTDVKVDIVWDPPWGRDRMSDAAKLQLGLF